MPEGKCPNCGTSFHGWALTDPGKQTCPECGAVLEMIDCERREAKSESSADERPIDSTPDDHQSDDKGKGNRGQ